MLERLLHIASKKPVWNDPFRFFIVVREQENVQLLVIQKENGTKKLYIKLEGNKNRWEFKEKIKQWLWGWSRCNFIV